MALAPSNLVYPPSVTADADRYLYLYAALEQLRLKHNEREGDTSPEARHWRNEWKKVNNAVIEEILVLRQGLKTPDFHPTDEIPDDPALTSLKADGKAAYRDADYKTLTGIDLDKVSGAASFEDPTEDFTAFSDTSDPGTDIVVTASKLDCNGVSQQTDTYWWDDKGANHFGPAFEHLFEATSYAAGSSIYAICIIWGVSNVAANEQYLDDNSSQAVAVYLITKNPVAGGCIATIKDYEDDSSDSYNSIGHTKYYYTTERTSETAIQCRIYNDAARTGLQDTIATTIPTGRRYRYVAGMAIEQNGQSRTLTIDIEKLDLQEAAPPAGNRRRRLLICGAG